MNYLLNMLIAFVAGYLLGLLFTSVLQILFWICVGTLVVLFVDVAMGLGARACIVRGWFRKPRYAGNVVRFSR